MDARIIIKIFAKKISSKLPLNAETPRNLPTVTLNLLLVDLIESLLDLPTLQNHLTFLRKYSKPNKVRLHILNNLIHICVTHKKLKAVNENELSIALRLAIIDSTDAELLQLIEACNECRDEIVTPLQIFTNAIAIIGALIFATYNLCMDLVDIILRREINADGEYQPRSKR